MCKRLAVETRLNRGTANVAPIPIHPVMQQRAPAEAARTGGCVQLKLSRVRFTMPCVSHAVLSWHVQWLVMGKRVCTTTAWVACAHGPSLLVA